MSITPPPPPGDGGIPPAAYTGLPAYPGLPTHPGGAQPYMAPQAGPAPGYAYAGFGARFLGYFIDAALLVAVQAALYVPLVIIPLVTYFQEHPIVHGQTPVVPSDLQARVYVISLIVALVSALYFGGLVALHGHTVGQRLMGMDVVRAEDGGKLPAGRSFLRAAIFWAPGLLGLVPFIGWAFQVLAIIGLLAVAWDSRKQGWHDRWLGRSLVVKRVSPPGGYT